MVEDSEKGLFFYFYYFLRTDDSTGTQKTDMITFHGCEQDLAGALGQTFNVLCEGHTNACFNVSKEDIQDEFLTEAIACFCEGDRLKITMFL